MEKINNGGPAFPHEDRAVWGDRTGMTLRDYFAAKAMPACVTQCVGDTRLPGESQAELIARRAYELADAMLRAREA